VAQQDDTDKDVIKIKKYANRRLYNTATSSYVTLEDLAQMVRDGEEFIVHDAKTGDDITRSVLTQIIFELEAKGQNLLPIKFLRHLITLYGDSLQSFVPSYLDMSMDTFSREQDRMRERFTDAFGGPERMNQWEEQIRRNMSLFEDTFMRMFAPFAGAGGRSSGGDYRSEYRPAPRQAAETAPPPETAKPEKTGEEKAELDELKKQMAEMQSMLKKLAEKD
jgi:polyhydroxyalkanoate synthesis repressor PhaR